MLLYICYNSNSILLNILIFLYYFKFKMMINNMHYIFICWHFKNAYICFPGSCCSTIWLSIISGHFCCWTHGTRLCWAVKETQFIHTCYQIQGQANKSVLYTLSRALFLQSQTSPTPNSPAPPNITSQNELQQRKHSLHCLSTLLGN